MRVLVACEYSGRVRDAFIARGHDAVSCDLEPTEAAGPHFRMDVGRLLSWPWDIVIAFPPCTKLSCIGAAHWKRWQADGSQDAAARFFLRFVHELKHVPRVAIENPKGVMSTLWRRPDQYVQPWWFGDPWTKRTGLWLKGLPLLVPTNEVAPIGPWIGKQRGKTLPDGTRTAPRLNAPEGALTAGRKRDSGIERSRARQLTFPGVAEAMANQWG